MSALTTKKELLENAGYTYNFHRMVYFNQNTKKVFSIEAIEDHDDDWLQRCLTEENGSRKWRFYFNNSPSEAIQHELISKLS